MRQLTVIGTGLACAVGTSAADLLEALDGAGAEGSAVTRPAVSDGTPTQAVLARAKSAIDDLGRLKWRRYMGQEAEMFVAAALTRPDRPTWTSRTTPSRSALCARL